MTQPTSQRFLMENRIGAASGVQGFDADLQGISNALLTTAGVIKTNGSSVFSSALIVDSDITVGTIANDKLADADLKGIGNATLTTAGVLKTNGSSVYSSGLIVNADITAGTIANDRLVNTGITFGSTAQALGSTVSNIAGVTVNSTTIPTSKTLVTTDTSTGAFTGGITTATGNGTIQPLKIPAGTLLGTPVSKVIESDTSAIYATTDAAHGRGAIKTVLFTSGLSPAVSNLSTAQALFPVPNDTLTVAGSTTYMFEAVFTVQQSATNSVAHALQFAIGGTATTTSWGWVASCNNGNSTSGVFSATNAQASGTTSGLSTLTTISSASTAGTISNRNVIVKGIIRINATGTLIPQIAFSAPATVTTYPTVTTFVNNYFSLTPIGSSSVASIGAWA